MVVRRGIGIALSSGADKPTRRQDMQTPNAEIAVARDFQKLRSIFTPSYSRAAPPIHARAPPFSFLFSSGSDAICGTGASPPPNQGERRDGGDR